MLNAPLPKTVKKTLKFPHFPTVQQVIVWRNWGLVPVDRIAKVLKTTQENINRMARDIGLRDLTIVNEKWLKRGYITIIRNNWHIVSYSQLLILLGWSEGKLANILKEDDFLSVKMGNFKPDVEEVSYTPLTEAQTKRTEEIKYIVERHFPHTRDEYIDESFGFLKEFEVTAPKPKEFGMAKQDEVMLDGQWRVVNLGQTKNLGSFIQRFISKHESKWGIKLNNCDEEGTNKNIKFEIKKEKGKLSESHSIEITEDMIFIRAVDEVGLLRGLQWIAKAMDIREGPFLNKGLVSRETRFDTRIVYAYSAVFGDPLLETDMDPYPEGLLAKLSDLGVNGIWLQGVLYTLVPWDEAPELSFNWEKRIDGLNNLIKRAAEYGIGVYLYLNEPRSMANSFFDKHSDWKGHVEGDYSSLCTSVKPVQDFLRNGVRKLIEETPELAGIITITMSENLTNCYSRTNGHTSCPRCADREPSEVIAEVNKLIAEGAHSVNPDARIISWTWGWQNPCGKDILWIKDALKLLPNDVRVMCTSEEGIETDIAGVKGSVLDYSMSVVGPGKRALENWTLAASKGLKTMAKVQFNNTWECSAVPYIPVPGLVAQHMERLINVGVTGLMLGWTLGGYPSLNLEIASQYYWKHDNMNEVNLSEIAQIKFGNQAGKIVHHAWESFSKAFKEFPFNIGVLYTAPQNFGPKNLLYKKPTGFSATMIGFPFDDLESWRGIYPEEVFEEQFKKLSEEWKRGLEILEDAERVINGKGLKELRELKDVAGAAYCHFKSTYLQIAFVRLRNLLSHDAESAIYLGAKKKILVIINEELVIAKALYDIAARDSRIGYEASNHYFYTLQDLIEKVISCEYLHNEYLEDK